MKNRVLVFPCGSEIGLEIYRSLRFSKDFEVYGASSVDDHGKFVYENYVPDMPQVEDKNFVGYVNKVVKKHSIDFIFPSHDSVVLKLAQNSDKIAAKIVTSPVRTCEIARSKQKTYDAIKQAARIPKVYTLSDELPLPVFLKPDVGQGSKGTLRADTRQEVEEALRKNSDLLILEYLPGKEYTIDCFTNKNGELLFAQPRERARTSNGISVNSRPVQDNEFLQIAKAINEVLHFRGVWFFQLKRDSQNRLSLLEVAPRVAGTMALCRMQGVNLPQLSLYDLMDVPVSVFKNDFDIEIDRALSAKYELKIQYDAVYVDFDDAIIVDGKVNELLIAFLYKNINQGKKIILITKHLKIVAETLAHQRIAESLFDEIICLGKDEEKSEHIPANSIFVDDSFSERLKVHDRLHVPVFDISEAIELI